MTKESGVETRVIGWYHSHPHITVGPSHVDVRTQASYQMMDEHFVGLIFSVFFEEKSTKHGRIQMTAFQSTYNQSSTSYQELPVPVHVSESHFTPEFKALQRLVELQIKLHDEELISYLAVMKEFSVDGHVSPLVSLHSSAVYTKALCRIMEHSCSPLLQSLNDLSDNLDTKLAAMQEEKEALLKELNELGD
eukprot:TRINITY_DN10458_c0_g1_i1.p1 TRINITY_DN10458_c0_g1~~TRINITY_DN10458_c0_g1_i1.p1  ORF type:complete len:192 (-),score=37.22 TRINITY_DN10458_c0_g1_i1:3-578(-)